MPRYSSAVISALPLAGAEWEAMQVAARAALGMAAQATAWEPLPHQTPPAGDWETWLLLAGRGSGKTAAAAHYTDEHVRGPPACRACRAATASRSSRRRSATRSTPASTARAVSGHTTRACDRSRRPAARSCAGRAAPRRSCSGRRRRRTSSGSARAGTAALPTPRSSRPGGSRSVLGPSPVRAQDRPAPEGRGRDDAEAEAAD
jgi:hypothetical protein